MRKFQILEKTLGFKKLYLLIFAKISKLRKNFRLQKLHLIIFAKLDVLGFDMWIAGFKTFNLKHVISIIWPEGYNYSCAIKTIKSNWKKTRCLLTNCPARFSVFDHFRSFYVISGHFLLILGRFSVVFGVTFGSFLGHFKSLRVIFGLNCKIFKSFDENKSVILNECKSDIIKKWIVNSSSKAAFSKRLTSYFRRFFPGY